MAYRSARNTEGICEACWRVGRTTHYRIGGVIWTHLCDGCHRDYDTTRADGAHVMCQAFMLTYKARTLASQHVMTGQSTEADIDAIAEAERKLFWAILLWMGDHEKTTDKDPRAPELHNLDQETE